MREDARTIKKIEVELRFIKDFVAAWFDRGLRAQKRLNES